MKIKLLDITKDPEHTIGFAASICYDAKTDIESCLKRASHCVDSGHLATLRFCYATFEISNISRVCSHQLVRVAHAGILQRSQRYVKESSIEYIDPPALTLIEPSAQHQWLQLQKDAEALYLHLVDSGQMKKEDARYILPQGCGTSLRITGNFQMWLDLLGNRMTKHAQWEVRAVAVEINRLLNEKAPGIFKV